MQENLQCGLHLHLQTLYVFVAFEQTTVQFEKCLQTCYEDGRDHHQPLHPRDPSCSRPWRPRGVAQTGSCAVFLFN